MHVISYITSHNDASRNLETSLIKYNYKYTFIGIGEKWKGFIKGKIKSLYNYLLSIQDDIICIIDGYDMLANGPPSELLMKYEKFGSNIVYGGEKFCFSYNGIPLEANKKLSILNYRKFLNGGFCIGKRKDIMLLYEWILKNCKDCNDDQKMACKYANIFPNRIKVDYVQQMVFNTITRFDTYNFKYIKKRIFIPSFNSFPCFIHFPSSESDNHERFNQYGKYILKNFIFLKSCRISFNFFSHFEIYIALIYLILNFLTRIIRF